MGRNVPLSLDPYYRLQPPRRTSPDLRCPKRPELSFLNVQTGQIVRGGCYSQKCPVCVQTIAWRYACAIGLARPEQHITLTQVGESWQDIQPRVTSFRRIVRRRFPGFHDVYSIEPNPLGTGNHLHMWSWGAMGDLGVIDDAAARSGMGREIHVSPRQRPAGEPLSYGLKLVLEADQSAGMSPEVTRFLLLNGGRLVHPSRGFWRDSDGTPISGVRSAMTVAKPSSGAWLAITDC